MENLIVEKVLEIEIKVSCNDGKMHTIGFANLTNTEDTIIDIEKDAINNNTTRCTIDFHLKCDSYDGMVDGNIVSYGGINERYFR